MNKRRFFNIEDSEMQLYAYEEYFLGSHNFNTMIKRCEKGIKRFVKNNKITNLHINTINLKKIIKYTYMRIDFQGVKNE